MQKVAGFGGAAVLDEMMRVAARGPELEPPRALAARDLERVPITSIGVVNRAGGAMDFGLQPRVLGIVRVLTGLVRDARRLVEGARRWDLDGS